MSNHDGSHMLNEILKVADKKYKLFDYLGPEKTTKFLKDVVEKIACNTWDCTTGEVLKDIAQKLGICRWCFKFGREIEEDDICVPCRDKQRKKRGW